MSSKLKYGIISEVDFKAGRARVYFDEIDVVSDWLALPDSMKAWKSWPVNCQVAVLMHEDKENGEILHRVITEGEEAPGWASETTEGYQFADNAYVYYDTATKKLTFSSTGEVEINCTKLTVNGSVEASGDVKAGTVSLKDHTHTVEFTLTAGENAVSGTITTDAP